MYGQKVSIDSIPTRVPLLDESGDPVLDGEGEPVYTAGPPNFIYEKIRVQPKYLLVPPAKAIIAAKIAGEYNKAVTEQQKLIVIVEGRLTGFAGWFLACDNPFASIALFTLRERTIPEIFTSSLITNDGLQVKHRMDYDVSPTDYRGLVRVS